MRSSADTPKAEMNGIERLLDIMERLRDPEGGCPWDREQTFATLVPYTLEEAYEVADSIQRNDMDELREELGDLLFQAVFYAQLAKENGAFDFHGVVDAIADKLVRRHPHVFADAELKAGAWEEHKAEERRAKAAKRDTGHSVLDGVALALPALKRAAKLQRRASRVGFDWPEVDGVIAKLEEELQELRAEMTEQPDPARLHDEVGDLLFSCVNLARHLDVEPETALRDANAKFERRFRRVEALLAEQGQDPHQASLEAMDALWDRAKEEEAGGAERVRNPLAGSR